MIRQPNNARGKVERHQFVLRVRIEDRRQRHRLTYDDNDGKRGVKDRARRPSINSGPTKDTKRDNNAEKGNTFT